MEDEKRSETKSSRSSKKGLREMTHQHRELASGRWNELSLVEQLGHAGSEVSEL